VKLKILLKQLVKNGQNLKELVIRPGNETNSHLYEEEDQYPWIHYWITSGYSGYIPQNVTTVTTHAEQDVSSCWMLLNTTPDDANDSLKNFCKYFQLPLNMPAGHTGCIKLYSSFKAPLSLCSFLPEFYLEFGRTYSTPLPYKKLKF